jgi:hypothetical protein
MRVLILALVLDCGGAQVAAGPTPSGSTAAASVTSQERSAPANGSEVAAPAASPSVSLPGSSASSERQASPSSAAPASNIDVAVRIGEIARTPEFDPQATIETMRPDILACYRKALATNGAIHGKVTLRIQVAESGAVQRVEAEPGGPADDPGLIGCIRDDFKANARFPKPSGSATVLAPLVFLFRAR